MESHPGIWYSKTHRELWAHNTQAVAEFVGADPKNLVFVSNATTGKENNMHALFIYHFSNKYVAYTCPSHLEHGIVFTVIC